MLCALILYISGGIHSLRPTSNDRFFEKHFYGNFIYSQSFCQKSAKRKSPKKYVFSCLTRATNPESTSNKPTYNLLDYDDFIYFLSYIYSAKEHGFQKIFHFNLSLQYTFITSIRRFNNHPEFIGIVLFGRFLG